MALLLIAAARYAVKETKDRELWENQGPLTEPLPPSRHRQQQLHPLSSPFAIPASLAGGELHVSVAELQVLEGRTVRRWLNRAAAPGRRRGLGEWRFKIQLGSSVQSGLPLARHLAAAAVADRPAAGPAASGRMLLAGAPDGGEVDFFRLPLVEGDPEEVKLFLYQDPGGKAQRLRAVARVPISTVFTAGKDEVKIPLFTRKGAAPLSVRVGLSYVRKGQDARPL